MKTKTAKQNETAKQNAIALNRELLSNVQDGNNVLTVATCHPTFQGHYFNLESENHGVANLIAEILAEREAQFKSGIEQSELRQIAIATSMFTEEIKAEIDNRFAAGTSRYPLKTVKQYLGVLQNPASKWYIAGLPKIGKIQLSGKEDSDRKSCRPRCKWYLVQE